jgi:hypothetical protein
LPQSSSVAGPYSNNLIFFDDLVQGDIEAISVLTPTTFPCWIRKTVEPTTFPIRYDPLLNSGVYLKEIGELF